MPYVVGLQLDVARSDLSWAGYKGDLEVMGEGTIRSSSEYLYTVCEQRPDAGVEITRAPRLLVSHTCPGMETEPTETESAPETDSSTEEATEPPIERTREEYDAGLMPDVLDLQLDEAIDTIISAEIEDDIEVIGGGNFLGVIDRSAWQVCVQSPNAGSEISDPIQLTVKRDCTDDSESVGSSTETISTAPKPSPTASPQATRPTSSSQGTQPIPLPDSSGTSTIDAAEMEATYLEHLGNNFIDGFGDMCDSSYTHWACFYDGASDYYGDLNITLTTDGGWSDSELKDLATTAGNHWFNFIGCDYPNLNTIIVTVNGLDYNVFRHNTNADAFCN